MAHHPLLIVTTRLPARKDIIWCPGAMALSMFITSTSASKAEKGLKRAKMCQIC